MIEVNIPADVQSYKSKLIAGFSLRQILSMAGAIAIAVPFAVIFKNILSEDSLIWTIILITIPFALIGFITVKDMPFEEFFKHWFSSNFLPRTRYYENAETDEYDEILITAIENILTESEGDEI